MSLRRRSGRPHVLDPRGEELLAPEAAEPAGCGTARRHGWCGVPGRFRPLTGDGHRGVRGRTAFYLACSEPYEKDRLGRTKLSKAGLAARDRMDFGECRDADLPVAVAMAGGYARDVEDTAATQAETIWIAASMFQNP